MSVNSLFVIVEGESELAYCQPGGALGDYFNHQHIFTYPFKHETGWDSNNNKPAKGGILNWNKFVKEVATQVDECIRRGLVNADQKLLVTTLIDLYGLEHEARGLDYRKVIAGCNSGAAKAQAICKRLFDDVVAQSAFRSQPAVISQYFLPFCLPYEFEAILFCDLSVLSNWFNDDDSFNAKIRRLELGAQLDQPEEINDSPQTAPSKRIINEFPEYESLKGPLGGQFATQVGITKAMELMPTFKAWISQIELHFSDPTTQH